MSSFILGLQHYGRNWSTIQKLVPTRTASQIRTHAQKFFIRLEGERGKTDLLAYVRSRPAAHFVDPHRAYARLSAGKHSVSDEGNLESSLNPGPSYKGLTDLDERVDKKKRRKLEKPEEEEKEVFRSSFVPSNSSFRPLPISAATNSSININHKFNQGPTQNALGINFNVSTGNGLYRPQPPRWNPLPALMSDKLAVLQQSSMPLRILADRITSSWVYERTQPYSHPRRVDVLGRLSLYANKLSQAVSDLICVVMLAGGTVPHLLPH